MCKSNWIIYVLGRVHWSHLVSRIHFSGKSFSHLPPPLPLLLSVLKIAAHLSLPLASETHLHCAVSSGVSMWALALGRDDAEWWKRPALSGNTVCREEQGTVSTSSMREDRIEERELRELGKTGNKGKGPYGGREGWKGQCWVTFSSKPGFPTQFQSQSHLLFFFFHFYATVEIK